MGAAAWRVTPVTNAQRPVYGVVAIVVPAAGSVPDLTHPPVRVEAAGTQILERLERDQPTLTREPPVEHP
jgi:hypothetical protein